MGNINHEWQDRNTILSYFGKWKKKAIEKMGYSGAEVARFLGVTTSAVNKAASSKQLPEVENI